MGACYIMIAIDYLNRWGEAQPVKDCSAKNFAKFIFKYILSLFGCLKILMSDQGSHFLDEKLSC